jgi:hypothetical protein
LQQLGIDVVERVSNFGLLLYCGKDLVYLQRLYEKNDWWMLYTNQLKGTFNILINAHG